MQSVRNWGVNLGLWPRMAISISLGFLVLFIAFSLLGERAIRDSTNRIFEERLIITHVVTNQIDALLLQTAGELVQTRRVADFDPSEANQAEEAELLDQTFTRMAGYTTSLLFLDATGRLVLSDPSGQFSPGTDVSEIPFVAEALTRYAGTNGASSRQSRGLRTILAEPQAFISTPFRHPVTDRPVVAVTIPVYRNEGMFVGLLSSLVDLEAPEILMPLQQAHMLSDTGHASLVDRQGRTLTATFETRFHADGEHITFFRHAMQQHTPMVDIVPVEREMPGARLGDDHVVAVVPLETAPWGVALGDDAEQTFAGLRRLRRGLLLLGVVTLISTWLATLFGTRRLVQPVQRLTTAAQRIAEGDLEKPLHAPEGGEIGALATALDRMRLQLLTTITKLSGLNENLEQRVAERTEALQRQQALAQHLLRRAITAQEEERGRLAYELHDEVGQTLTAIQLNLERLATSLPADDVAAHQRLKQVEALTEQSLDDLRRVIAALRPGVLDQLGLVPALNWIADHTLRPLGICVHIDIENVHGRLPNEIETVLFRIAQEAMHNVARHSEATRVSVSLERTDNELRLTLVDDGRGFDPSTLTVAADPRQGLGLAGMRERASLVGGHVEVRSTLGEGTTVRVTVPLQDVTELESPNETNVQDG